MKTKPVTVTDMHGNDVPATLLLCSECSNGTFAIFVIGESHQHLQCLQCEESFCDGSCENQKEN